MLAKVRGTGQLREVDMQGYRKWYTREVRCGVWLFRPSEPIEIVEIRSDAFHIAQGCANAYAVPIQFLGAVQ